MSAPDRGQRGMTLVELMVAMAIGLGLTLAITTMLIAAENHKRTTTSTNDAEQTGAYAIYALDRALRGAGSAIADSAYPVDRGVLGCKLNAASLLPRASAFPAPFAGFLSGAPSNLRVAPLVIGYNQSDAGSDVLMVMNGSGSAGGVPRQLTGVGSSTTLVLDNTVGFAINDLTIISQSGTADCLLEQATQVTTPNLTLGGTYITAGTTTTISTLAASTLSYVTPVGNATANNVQFQLLGVGANRTLFSYDLLQNLRLVQGSGTDASQAIADGVIEMHALYGLDSDGDGVQDTWVSPAASPYDIVTVMATPATMRKILAVRVALIVRGEYADKNQITPATLTIFNGLTTSSGTALTALKRTITLSSDDRYYRYRVFEFTIPLRNMLLLAAAS